MSRMMSDWMLRNNGYDDNQVADYKANYVDPFNTMDSRSTGYHNPGKQREMIARKKKESLGVPRPNPQGQPQDIMDYLKALLAGNQGY